MIRRRWIVLGLAILAVPLCLVARGQKPPPDSVELLPDITYVTVGGQELKLDLARPKAGKGPFPIIVCLHGGGWQAGSKADFREISYGLVQQGYATASMQYRLAPKHRYPAQLDDVKAAVKFLRENAKTYNLDPDRLGAVGGSAGGHLALMLATEPEMKLKAAVSLSGPTALAADLPKEATDILVTFIDATRADALDTYKAASPITRIGPGTAPIFMVHGDKDPLVPYTQATAMLDACKIAGLDVELATIPDGTHSGGGTAEANAAAVTKALLFLRARLKP